MKDDHWEFTTVAMMAAFAIMCLVGVGVLIILENVTKDNSFGIDGIVEALKAIAAGLVGGLITLTRQGAQLPSPAPAPTPAATPIAAPSQEK